MKEQPRVRPVRSIAVGFGPGVGEWIEVGQLLLMYKSQQHTGWSCKTVHSAERLSGNKKKNLGQYEL